MDDNVFEDGFWGNVDGLIFCCYNDDGIFEDDIVIKVDCIGDGEVVKFNDFGDVGDVFLEVGYFFEVIIEFD